MGTGSVSTCAAPASAGRFLAIVLIATACESGRDLEAPSAAGTTADDGAARTATESQAALSPCVSLAAAPATCDEICGATGASCDPSGCSAGGPGLPATALFYSDGSRCADNAPTATEVASCNTPFGTAGALFPVSFVRCCCTAGGTTTGADALAPVRLCADACAAKRPDFSRSRECADTAFCDERCEEALLGTTGECSRCIADSLQWDAGNCGASECRCTPPAFAGRDTPECAVACAGG